jgi:putative transferase (TIGR04331 family)
MNEQYTLVTTELEETWPVDGKVLFLGEWCRLHARRQEWHKLEGHVQPYHWDDRDKLKRDFDYLQGLNQRLLLELLPIMNTLHQVNYDVDYWRLILGYWLNNYTAVLFDRWSSIEVATNAGLLLKTNVLTTPDGFLASNDTADFIRQATENPYWNHALFNLLIHQKTCIVTTTIKADQNLSTLEATKACSKKSRVFKTLASQLMSFVSKYLKKNDRVTMMSTYLPRKAEWCLEVKFGQIPSYWKIPEVSVFPFDATQRIWQHRTLLHTDKFETLARQVLPELLPKAFVEGYKQLTRNVEDLPWPKSPRVIWTSNYHFSCELFKYWAAKKCADGCRLVIGEHGGLGTGAFNGAHSYEVSVADSYLSTGWSDVKQTKIIPIGNFRQVNRKQIPLNNGLALLVCGIMPRYSFDIRSMMLSSQVIDYLNDQFRFVDALQNEIKKNLLVRLYHSDYFWDQKGRWEERQPGIRLDSATRPIWEVAKGCRLFIATYNATTYIESLSLNFPTVIFWNPNHWEVKVDAQPFFDGLKEVGIFHETPESAAQHINKIWHDVTKWWQREDVQMARAHFCEAYASNPPDILDRLETLLREEAAIGEALIGSKLN